VLAALAIGAPGLVAGFVGGRTNMLITADRRLLRVSLDPARSRDRGCARPGIGNALVAIIVSCRPSRA
jgi:hypothetical protein